MRIDVSLLKTMFLTVGMILCFVGSGMAIVLQCWISASILYVLGGIDLIVLTKKLTKE